VRLAELIQSKLESAMRGHTQVDLKGAMHTADWLMGYLKDKTKPNVRSVGPKAALD
jgi:hypothetical protein